MKYTKYCNKQVFENEKKQVFLICGEKNYWPKKKKFLIR